MINNGSTRVSHSEALPGTAGTVAARGDSAMSSGSAASADRAAGADVVRRFVPYVCTLFIGSLVFLGVLHVIFGEDLARLMQAWPAQLPGRPYWAHVMGALIAASAGMMFVRGWRHRAAVVLAGLLLLPVLGLHLPRALPSGTFGNAWLIVVKWLALAAGPLLVAWHLPAPGGARWLDRVIRTGALLAPWLMGVFMVTSAVMHVRYAPFVVELMQPWMPWRLFWVYFAAVALAAGGVGLVIPKTAGLAALLSSLMIFLWFFLVHTPRMLIDPLGPVGWSEMAESLAFSALAFLLALRARKSVEPAADRAIR
jgi:uncharacterized membrane protein